MELTTTSQIRDAIKAIPRAEWPALSSESGVPQSTIEKIAYGVTTNPSFDSAVGLVEALKRREAKHAALWPRERGAA